MTNKTNTKPVHEVRVGGVRASIWKNQSRKGGAFYTLTFTRLYKSGEEWKRSDSFGRNDLAKIKEVADAVGAWISSQSQPPARPAEESAQTVEQ